MKLRIKGNSLRLRVSRSELTRFLSPGRIEETIILARDPKQSLPMRWSLLPSAPKQPYATVRMSLR